MQSKMEQTGQSYEVWILLVAIFGFMSYLQVVWHRERVAIVEAGLAVVYLFIIFPIGTFSNYVTSKGTSTPTCIFQLVLTCFLSQAIAFYLTKKSPDPEVSLCKTVVNILTRGALSLCAIYGIMNVKSISNLSCLVTLVVLVPLILGDLIHLFSMRVKYDITVGDPVSWHLSVDAMSTFFLGCCILAFPNLFCGKMDGATGLVTKALGCMITGQSLLSFGALCFRAKDDALATLKAKLVMHAVSAVVVMASYYTDQYFWINGHPFGLMIISGFLARNALQPFVK